MNSLGKLFINREIFILSFSRFFQSMSASVFFPLLPLYIGTLDSSLLSHVPISTKAGILVSFFGIAMTLAQFPVVYFSDRYQQTKPMILMAIIIFSLLCLCLGQVSSFLGLLLVRSCQGLCIGATIPLLLAMLSGFSLPSNRGQAMGCFSTLHLIGFAIGPLVGGLLADAYGIFFTFYVGAILSFISFLLLFFFIPKEVQNKKQDSTFHPRSLPKSKKISLEIYVLGGVLFAMMTGITLIIPLFPIYQRELHATYSDLSWVFSSFIITRMITQIPVGFLSDSYSKRKLIVWGLLIFAPATLLLGFTSSIWEMIVMRLIQGGSATLIMTPAMALSANLAPKELKNKAMGVIGMGISGGVAFGPLMSGLGIYISLDFPFWISGILSCFFIWTVLKFVKEEPSVF